MEINGISAANTTNPVKPDNPGQALTGGLGQDAFMELLLAQLRNQDPLKPMEDKDFIAQLAQFNSLNQLTQMSQTLDELVKSQSLGQGSALIGKTVNGISSAGEVRTGIVTGLQISGDQILLDMDGTKIPLSNVQSVQQTERSDENDRQSQSFDSNATG